MQLHTLERPCASGSGRVGHERASLALAGVIGCVGRADFGASALAHLNQALPLCWLSIYKLGADGPPTLHASGSCGAADGTVDAFDAYRSGLYARDPTFLEAAERTRHGGAALTHWHAREIPIAHRRLIYTRHSLQERASVVSSESDGGVLAINVYRNESQPAFDEADIELLRDWGLLLLATVQTHIRVFGASRFAGEPAPTCSAVDTPSAAPSNSHGASPILATLPRREREVCERMLRGWTYDGIGADLGIAAGTVKTYRDRAFDRLGLHHRNELFAMALNDVDHRGFTFRYPSQQTGSRSEAL